MEPPLTRGQDLKLSETLTQSSGLASLEYRERNQLLSLDLQHLLPFSKLLRSGAVSGFPWTCGHLTLQFGIREAISVLEHQQPDHENNVTIRGEV